MYEPISLGHTCEVKYQLCRKIYFTERPDAPPTAVRDILSRGYGSSYFDRHIFDFQITPFSAVCEYLRSDFAGVFERADLFVDPVTGHVTHRRLWTSFPHDFEAEPEGAIDEALIDRVYPEARAKFEHLAGKFRALLQRPGQFLYVFMETRGSDEARALLELLSAGHPRHEAKLLLVDDPARPGDYTGLGGRVLRAPRTAASGKAPQHDWEGDDAGWDVALAPFDLARAAAGAPL